MARAHRRADAAPLASPRQMNPLQAAIDPSSKNPRASFMTTDDPDPAGRTADPAARASGEATVLWVIWLTYGSFYFCRQNIAVAVPGLKDEGLNTIQIGSILG